MRVLIVEDSPLQARLVRELLAEAGGEFECEWADRLSAALGRLGRGGIDAVLLDLTLPDSWGLESLEALRRSAPAVPVVVLAGSADDALRAGAGRLGALAYIGKDEADAAAIAAAVRRAAGISRSGPRRGDPG